MTRPTWHGIGEALTWVIVGVFCGSVSIAAVHFIAQWFGWVK